MKEYCGTFKIEAYVDFYVEAENELQAFNKVYDEYFTMNMGDIRDNEGELIELKCLDIEDDD